MSGTSKALSFPVVIRLLIRAENAIDGVTRTREVDGGLEIGVRDSERIVPRIVNSAEGAGFDVVELSVAEPSLETVFISLTGKELRD